MITTTTGSDTLTPEHLGIDIIIPQEAAKIMHYLPAFVGSIGVITTIILTGTYVEPVVTIAVLLFVFFMHIFLFLVDRYLSPFPAGTPEMFRIYPEEKIVLHFWSPNTADDRRVFIPKWYLSTTQKLMYSNTRFRKKMKAEWLNTDFRQPFMFHYESANKC